jgi:hypothetical protein
MDDENLITGWDFYNDVNNNKNEYVNNILNEYYLYNPNTINKEEILKKINKQIQEINNEEKKNGIENPISSIDSPLKVITDQYETPFSQGVSMYDNRGKYFDLYDFNKDFDTYIRQQQKQRLLNEKLKLTDLSTIDSIKIKPYQLPLDKILIETKNTWFDFFDKLLIGKNPFTDINENQIFYFALTLIITSLLYIMLWFFFQ